MDKFKKMYSVRLLGNYLVLECLILQEQGDEYFVYYPKTGEASSIDKEKCYPTLVEALNSIIEKRNKK